MLHFGYSFSMLLCSQMTGCVISRAEDLENGFLLSFKLKAYSYKPNTKYEHLLVLYN